LLLLIYYYYLVENDQNGIVITWISWSTTNTSKFVHNVKTL